MINRGCSCDCVFPERPRFAKSGKFSGVVAADFSETMLQQSRSYFREDGTLGGSTPITLLRADVARLPFSTGSQAAIHAGMWPCAVSFVHSDIPRGLLS